MRNFDVRVTWGMPDSGLTRTTVVKVAASTEELALAVARRSARFEGVPPEAETRTTTINGREQS